MADLLERRTHRINLEHVEHQWTGTVAERMFAKTRVLRTHCGKRFIVGGWPRDWAVHDPATSRCTEC